MYPSPIAGIPALAHLFRPGQFPGAEALADRLVTVPVHPLVSAADARAIGRGLTAAVREAI
jgi:dTDP-4-amino-4,6-dideoxygalactose transaminase